MANSNSNGIKIITTNRRARHDYFIEDTLEAGIVLTGTEIKSIRNNRVSISEAYVGDHEGEMWIYNMHVSPYDHASSENHEPTRPRKLLMHRKEIERWSSDVQRKGYTIVPLNIHLRHGRAKLDIGLAKGKKNYDKRQAMKERDDQRDVKRALRERQRNY